MRLIVRLSRRIVPCYFGCDLSSLNTVGGLFRHLVSYNVSGLIILICHVIFINALQKVVLQVELRLPMSLLSVTP